jgi:hypothetical protein
MHRYGDTPSAGIVSFLEFYGLPVLFAVLTLNLGLKYKKKSIIGLAVFTLVYYVFWLLVNAFFQGGGDMIFYFLHFGPWGYVYSNGIALLALIDFSWPIVFSIFSVVWGYREMKSRKTN